MRLKNNVLLNFFTRGKFKLLVLKFQVSKCSYFCHFFKKMRLGKNGVLELSYVQVFKSLRVDLRKPFIVEKKFVVIDFRPVHR